MFQAFRTQFAAALLSRFFRVLSWSWRIEHRRRPEVAPPYIYGHWHGDELLLVGAFAGQGLAVMASRSRDGELMARVLGGLGYKVTRGSSSRGGAGGLKGLVDSVCGQKLNAAVAVDGPRGPRYQVKPGILFLAQQSGRPILPGAVAAKKAWVFRSSWNRCFLPKPFTSCVVVYGEPVYVPKESGALQLKEVRLALELQLQTLKAEARAIEARS